MDKMNKTTTMSNQPWIQAVHINNLRQLQNFDIQICDERSFRHLFLTGPNGSGKTTFLHALREQLEMLAKDHSLQHRNYKSLLSHARKRLDDVDKGNDPGAVVQARNQVQHWEQQIKQLWDKLEARISHEEVLPEKFEKREFIIAFYKDTRVSSFKAPVNPTKPKISNEVQSNNGGEFLNFLVDQKVQQALASANGKQSDADAIGEWFTIFQGILRKIFADELLELLFDYKDYSFSIQTQGRRFPFTGLSAGYAAVMDIVADLILKMHSANRLKRIFDMPGIVLVDEVETHLHLALQKQIMPILTGIFPKIQFIVTTHSPFVLNSDKNATVYDLKSHERVEDLTEYSYEALAEGFLGVDTESGELRWRLDRMDELVHASSLTDVEKDELERYIEEFRKVPDALAPRQKARFNDLHRIYLLKRA